METKERLLPNQRISPYPGEDGDLDLHEILGHHIRLALDHLESSHLIDNVNFSGAVFPHVIDPRRAFDLYPLEPGYTTLDAALEMGAMIKHIEIARLCVAEPSRAATFRKWMERAGIGVSNAGCTGVIQQVLAALLDLSKEVFPRQNSAPEIVAPLPCYSVFPIQMANLRHRVKVRWAVGRREDDFLCTFEDVRRLMTDRTIAVILTYPANPSMATYEGDRLDDLRSIVRLCKEKGVFLIVDNIFQDMLHSAADRESEEIFRHTEGLEGVVKIYGPSKDVPFFGGYRMGYWIGDNRLCKGFRAAAANKDNGVNMLSLVLLALHLYFRSLRLEGRQPALEDMDLFADAVFGSTSSINRVREVKDHRQLFDSQAIFENIVELDLYGDYLRGMERTEEILATALRRLKHFAEVSDAFSDWVNHDIGSVFFMKVNPEVFPGTDVDLFHFALEQAQVGILPGSGFGLECRRGDAWFRITTTHDPIEGILDDLKRLEQALLHQASTPQQTSTERA